MRVFSIKISCLICQSEFLKLRVSAITIGIIFIFLGIQGIFDILESNLTYMRDIKLYSSLVLVLGIIFLLLGLLKVGKYEAPESENLLV